MNLTAYIQRQIEWSRRTFGPTRRTKGLTEHIRKELMEIEAEPEDLTEWIDVIILGLDGAWRTGATAEQIAMALEVKQARNFQRTYPFPKSDDEPSEHVREGRT